MRAATTFSLLLLSACGDAADAPSVTYHRDVRPILEQRCGECHGAGGVGGVVFTEQSTPQLIGLVLSKILNGDMPPWPPGPESMPLLDARQVLPRELATLQAWQRNGTPLGDPASYRAAPTLGTPAADLELRMPEPYAPPPSTVSDSYRCYLFDAPPMWIRGYRWAVKDSTRRASHHVGAAVLTSAGREQAKRLEKSDGLPGWDCPMDFGLRAGDFSTTLGSGGVGKVTPTWLPEGTGIEAPAGIVYTMHYLPEWLREPDKSGVDVWTSGPAIPVKEWLVGAPVELPCPSGVSTDPAHPCSRDRALTGAEPMLTLDELRRKDDAALAACGQTYERFIAGLDWRQGFDRFIVSTSCDQASPFSGQLLSVHVHTHTRAVSARAELQREDGSWLPLLDIPRWRWVWESAYSFASPVTIKLGQRVRVSCTFDNGNANQWSVFAGPGHDAPAVPPLEAPAFRVAGLRRSDEMCGVTFQWVAP